MTGTLKTCAWCGASFYGDGRHKYCSEQCCEDAHREKCKLNFRRRYAERHEEELACNRTYYANNRGKTKARVNAWHRAHPEKQREYYRRNYAKNRDKIIARVKEYQTRKKAEQ